MIKRICSWFKRKKEIKPIMYEKYSLSTRDFDTVALLPNGWELEIVPFLCDVAYSHSKYMADKVEVSHDNFLTRAEQIRIIFGDRAKVSEVTGGSYRSAEGFVNALKKSEKHNIIINKIWKQVGVATVDGYSTVIFTA